MAEYIESICRSCFHSYVCEQFNRHRDSHNEKCHFYNDHFAPAADVVAVVRCKDCKHFADAYGKDSGKPCGYGQCKSISGVRWIVCADDYCSSGERRDEDG